MKNIFSLTLVFTLFTTFTILGQPLDKGNFLLGSTVGFSTSDSKVTKTEDGVEVPANGPTALQVSVAPNVGYFVFDNFALGLGFDYTFSSVEQPDLDKTDDSDLLFGPFLRYYIPFENDMAFFIVTDFGFGKSSDNQLIAGENRSIDNNVFAIGVGPGITIFSNNGIGLEALFKYNYARSNFETEIGGIRTSSKTTTSQFDVSVGFQFYFGGMKRIGG